MTPAKILTHAMNVQVARQALAAAARDVEPVDRLQALVEEAAAIAEPEMLAIVVAEVLRGSTSESYLEKRAWPTVQ